MNKPTIGLFDDHPYILSGISGSLAEAKFKVIFQTTSKATLFEYLKYQLPDVLILDIVSDEVRGLENFEDILKLYPNQKILAFSSLDSVVLIDNLLSLGVRGFVNKKSESSVLIQAIAIVNEGKIAVDDQYKHLTSNYTARNTAILTPREIDIVNGIATEMTSAAIAENLNLSVNTIESHRKRIFQKLNVKNVAGMIMESNRLGYLK